MTGFGRCIPPSRTSTIAIELSGAFRASSCSDSAATSMRGRLAIVKLDIVRMKVVFMSGMEIRPRCGDGNAKVECLVTLLKYRVNFQASHKEQSRIHPNPDKSNAHCSKVFICYVNSTFTSKWYPRFSQGLNFSYTMIYAISGLFGLSLTLILYLSPSFFNFR